MLRVFDVVSLAFSVVVVVLVTGAVSQQRADRAVIRITAPNVKYLFEPGHQEVITVDGPIGQTVIQLSTDGVAVIESPCTNKICIRRGHIDQSGQWIACLPNRVFVSIEGARGSREYDAISY